MLSLCRIHRTSWSTPSTALCTRGYAISVQPTRALPGKRMPRVFKDKKAFQFNWYTNILKTNATSPIIFLHHDSFTAQRLVKLRQDILAAYKRSTPSLTSPTPAPHESGQPTLTIVRTSIFGAALRELPDTDLAQVEKLVEGQKGGFAVLTLPSLNPPQLAAIIRAMDKSVPSRPQKTPEEIKQELAQKNADPEQPGRRMKRQRLAKVPALKLMGALVEGRVLLPEGVNDVSQLPTLDTLRAQIVGLLSAPASQLAAVLNEGAGGRLAWTLEGLKKGLEETPDAEAPKST